jgi:hypothetical protein
MIILYIKYSYSKYNNLLINLIIMSTNPKKYFRKYLLIFILAIAILGGSTLGYLYYANSAIDPSCLNLQANDTVRLDGDSYWYWLDNDKNLILVSSNILSSWGKIILPKTITAKCFDSLTASAKRVNYRPGTYLIKYQKTDQLYAVLPGNKFSKINTSTANQLYENYTPINFNAFWWMNIINKTADIATNTPHPGMLISYDNKKTIYYVDENSKLHLLTTKGFSDNNFNKSFVRNVSTTTANQMEKLGNIDQVLPHLIDRTQETTAWYPDPAPVTTTPTTTPSPTYSLLPSATSINEGNSIIFTLNTTNIVDRTNVAYTITGINSADLSSGALTGNFIINSNKATLTFALANDTTTEGRETMRMSLNNDKGNVDVVINDTSLTPAPPIPTTTPSTYGTTYYIRTDGGTATQCDGKTNVALNSNGHCAWSHPFIALPPGGASRIVGGDTLIIGNGSYKMGNGAPGTQSVDKCNVNWSWDCIMAPIPSGPSADKPTKILGANYNTGCSVKPELWGSGRPWVIVDMNGSSNVELQCLEITDHSSCIENHTGGLACQRSNPPFGDWASDGLRAKDSKNVLLKNIDIHGLASKGVFAARLTDWTVEDTKIEGNGIVGWDGDLPGENSSNSGTITFKRVKIEWNGCGQTYPGRQPAGCWGQTVGGYGDGLGTGATGGNWLIEDSTFSHNTSDGLDLLYHRNGGEITIRRVKAEGNAGNQLKTNGDTEITDSVIIGNCGFFNGKSFTYNVDNCRAFGNALSVSMEGATGPVKLYNNSVYSEGDCNIVSDSGSGSIISRNNIFYAGTDFWQPFEKSCFFYTGTNVSLDTDYDITYQTKDGNDYCSKGGSSNLCNTDPKFTSISKDNFNLVLQSTSPAINRGTKDAFTSIDFMGNSRKQGDKVDIGAYEIK